MAKLISELPDGLRQLAEKRRKERDKSGYFCHFQDAIINAFDWETTPEGDDFWDEIDVGNFIPYYEKYGTPTLEKGKHPNSRAAFCDKDNTERRKTHREIILEVMKMMYSKDQSFTVREIARLTELTFNQVNKRVSDLHRDGEIIVTGALEENGNMNSTYSWNQHGKIRDSSKPKTRFDVLRESMRMSFPDAEYRAVMDVFNQRWKNR